MTRVWLAVLPLALAGGTPAAAVGLGPLVMKGTIDGPREGFRLDLLNADADTADIVLYAVGLDDETPQPRVALFPAEARLGSNRSRKVLVVADGLQPEESFHFRVCAERKLPTQGTMIHARVCSKITAHRLR